MRRIRTIPPALTALTTVRRDESESAEHPLDWKLITRLYTYTRPYAVTRNRLLWLVLFRSLQLPSIAFLMGIIIQGPITNHDPYLALLYGAGLLALIVLTLVMFGYRSLYAAQLGEQVIHDLRRDLFCKLQSLPMSYYDRTHIGRSISRVSSDAEAVRQGVQTVFFVSMVQIGQMIGSALALIYLNGRLFLVVTAMAPFLYWIIQAFRKRLSRAYREVQESFSRVTATLAESVNGIRVTQSFSRQEYNAALFHNLLSDHAQYNLAVAKRAGIFVPLLDLNSQMFVAVALLIGGWQVLDGSNPDPASLIPFFIMVPYFFGPIQTIGNQYNQALASMAGAERVFSLLDRPLEWEDDPEAVDPGPISGEVIFQQVGFSYVPGRPVLRNLSFTAHAGQTVAIVGETGSGKSTVIKLISKFYLPSEGEIYIDGREIRLIRSEALQKQLGIVLQQNFLFTGTVMENIRLGRPGSSDEAVIEACRRLDCLDLLVALPNGLKTMVGEKGTGISLGQRQLICFSRAMLANPQILILDEATSSVDAITETRIQRALEVLLKGRTSFVIAHRLSTIRHADTVLVLDNGEILESGRHEDLLRQRGAYANLYRKFAHSLEA